ncbi:hypothetical protein BT69DRAFT_792634 [Atractiella rhizophila]|nr:hypothetical protein BT69DRAFT_792634 [Atractiella rhizophila]
MRQLQEKRVQLEKGEKEMRERVGSVIGAITAQAQAAAQAGMGNGTGTGKMGGEVLGKRERSGEDVGGSGQAEKRMRVDGGGGGGNGGTMDLSGGGQLQPAVSQPVHAPQQSFPQSTSHSSTPSALPTLAPSTSIASNFLQQPSISQPSPSPNPFAQSHPTLHPTVPSYPQASYPQPNPQNAHPSPPVPSKLQRAIPHHDPSTSAGLRRHLQLEPESTKQPLSTLKLEPGRGRNEPPAVTSCLESSLGSGGVSCVEE